LAAVHRDNIKPISLYDDVNVAGAKNICKIAEKHNINKIIFTKATNCSLSYFIFKVS